MDILPRIFLEMHTFDPDLHGLPLGAAAGFVAFRSHDSERPVRGERFVILRDLIALRQVRVKIIFPRKDRRFLDLQSECKGGPRSEIDHPPVENRQSSGQAKAHGARVRVRLRAGLDSTPAKYLCRGRKLGMDLHADDGFPAFFDHRNK